jgi:hypothetical protein
MQYARVWYVSKNGDCGSEEFRFPEGFPSNEDMQEWAEDIAERNDAQLDYWVEISREDYRESTQ